MSYLMIVAERNETQQSNLISSHRSVVFMIGDRNEFPEDSPGLHLMVYTQGDSAFLHIEYIRKLWS